MLISFPFVLNVKRPVATSATHVTEKPGSDSFEAGVLACAICG